MKCIAAVVLILLSIIAVAQEKPSPKKSTAKTEEKCAAGLNELCASDKFYAEYDRYKAYQAKYGPPPDVTLIMKGIMADLNEEIQAEMKQGYSWNEQKMRFVKPEPTAAVTPVKPTTSTPTAPPK